MGISRLQRCELTITIRTSRWFSDCMRKMAEMSRIATGVNACREFLSQ